MTGPRVVILRTDGTKVEYDQPPAKALALMKWIQKEIDAEASGCDTVNLRDGRVLVVDDTGAVTGKPENAEATKLYLSVCRPGTTWTICGDAAVCWDEDFA